MKGLLLDVLRCVVCDSIRAEPCPPLAEVVERSETGGGLDTDANRTHVHGIGRDLYIRNMEAFSHDNYNKKLQPFANKLRKDMTKAEACLWKYALQGRNMKGYQFRRQRPILNYIADFICLDLKLIIEVDGITHQLEEVYANDVIRQKALEAAGYTVIRFDDNEVLNNMPAVRQHILNTIEDIEQRIANNPPPSR